MWLVYLACSVIVFKFVLSAVLTFKAPFRAVLKLILKSLD